MNRLIWILFALPVLMWAQDDKPEIVAATEVDALKAKTGETLTVRGFIDRTGRSGSGINFLNFKDSTFVAVVFGQHVAKFEDGAPAEIFDEKWVEITGEIEIYKENPQIKVEDPKQIKIIEAPKSEPTAAASAAADPDPTPEPNPARIWTRQA
ncbi:MAG: OB-fold nucleic acid binding domain-containing protein, partial [Verrucomicrobiota bacterium]